MTHDFSSFLENRFVLCVGCALVSSVLLWYGKLDAQNYTLIIMGTVGAYIAGGVVERSKEVRAMSEVPTP